MTNPKTIREFEFISDVIKSAKPELQQLLDKGADPASVIAGLELLEGLAQPCDSKWYLIFNELVNFVRKWMPLFPESARDEH